MRHKTYLFVCLVPISLIFGPVFGFILTAPHSAAVPAGSSKLVCLGRRYLVSSGNQVAIWGKASSRAQRIQILIR
jgi:hypothetical protein